MGIKRKRKAELGNEELDGSAVGTRVAPLRDRESEEHNRFYRREDKLGCDQGWRKRFENHPRRKGEFIGDA